VAIGSHNYFHFSKPEQKENSYKNLDGPSGSKGGGGKGGEEEIETPSFFFLYALTLPISREEGGEKPTGGGGEEPRLFPSLSCSIGAVSQMEFMKRRERGTGKGGKKVRT